MAVARGLFAVALVSLMSWGCKRAPSQESGRDEAAGGAQQRATAPSDDEADTDGAASDESKSPAETVAKKGTIDWLDDERAALQRARSTGRPLLIDFAAQWCAPCQEMDEETFRDPRLIRTIGANFVALRFDVSAMSDDDKSTLERYRVEQLPVILVASPEGKELHRWSDFIEAGPMRETLTRFSSRD